MEPSVMDTQLYLSQIDLLMEGLDEPRQRVVQGDLEGALAWLQAYFRGRLRSFHPAEWRHADAEESLKKAALALDGKVSLLNSPLLDIGRPANWLLRVETNPEWTQRLASHEWLSPLVHAFEQTGDERFAARWVELVEDFLDRHDYGCDGIEFTPSRPMVFLDAASRGNGEGFYRLADGSRSPCGSWTAPACARRARSWLLGLSRLGGSAALTPDILLRILSSITGEHVHVLVNNPHEDAPSDFAVGAAALLEIALTLPEFTVGTSAFLVGVERLRHAIQRHMFSDGSDIEQSLEDNAQLVTLIKDILEILGEAPRARRTALEEAAKKRIRFIAYSATPQRQLVRIGRSWRLDIEPLLRDWTEFFELEDVRFIVTGGREGAEPPACSVAMPFGGYFVMRSDWEKDAHFLLFKASDCGAGFMHEDCLSVNVTAGGRDLLVDSGHFSHNQQGERDRLLNEYAASSHAHNTVVVDGCGQHRSALHRPGPLPDRHAATAMPIRSRYLRGQFFEYAEGEYADGYGPQGAIHARHERRILWLRGRGWLVFDTLRASGEHGYDLLWLLGPDFLEEDVAASEEFRSVWTESPGQNLALHFMSGHPLRISLQRGQESPPRGWCFRSYGERVPKTDIHVGWRGNDDQIIATYIQPYGPESRLAGPVQASLSSDERILSFLIEFEDGLTFEGRVAVGTRPLSLMNLEGNAELIVATRAGDGPRCVGVFGAEKFHLGRHVLSGCYEARVKSGGEWDAREMDAIFALGGGPSGPVESIRAVL